MQIEDLRTGADVVSRDGHKLGTLSRFVIQQGTYRLTHIVVDTGILRSGQPLWEGGWGLSHDRVVPLAAVASADSHAVRLTMSADEFRDHSVDYIEERFQPVPDLEPGRADLSDVERLVKSIPGEPGPVFITEVKAKAPDEVEIRADSPVWRLNPHQKVGEVERVLLDEETGKVVGLVIRRGFLFTREVVLPVRYIVEVVADVVRIDIDDDALRSLPEYRPED